MDRLRAIVHDRERHGGSTEVYKVKAHLDEEGADPLTEGRIAAADLIGNVLADGAAELAAESVEACPNEVLRVS